ncbi:protein kinase [Streptomyces parvus]
MGEVFAGRYELIDPIGRGGVGAVWRAWDHRRRRYVAAKVLQQSDAHTLLRFVREQALRIEHPHVLAPASWAADDDKVLFTMDLVSGGSLAHVIGDYGPLPPRFVCLLLDQLLSGLSTVHAEGVVHRDIKPANILMEATGTGRPHLRLSDFGISMRKGEPRLTETNYVVGTPGYFAPEQMMGAEPDFPADLFAVGLVALYLLQGRKPDAQALVEHFATHGTPGAPEGVPEPLWQVLAGLLQPDPHARFRTATGARKALTAAVEMLPEAGPDDEPVEVFDQIGPLPAGFGPDGPMTAPQEPSQQPAEPQAPAQPPVSMSETGSFHLAPPPAAPQPSAASQPSAAPPGVAAPQQQPHPQPGLQQPGFQQPPAAPYAADAPPAYAVGAPDPSQAPTSGVPHDPSATRPYTARHQQLPPVPAPPVQHAAPHPPVRRTRPGPPPKVAVPVLVVALICFAVGIWALTQV